MIKYLALAVLFFSSILRAESFQDVVDRANQQLAPLQLVTLKKCPDCIPTVAAWLLSEWGAYDKSLTMEKLVKSLNERLNEDKLPIQFVVLDNKTPIATVSLRERSDPEFTDFPEHSLWLGTLYVVPKERGKDIDEKLLVFTKDLAKQMGYKEIYVYFSDPSYVDWYVKRGAKVIGSRGFRNHTISILRINLS